MHLRLIPSLAAVLPLDVGQKTLRRRDADANQAAHLRATELVVRDDSRRAAVQRFSAASAIGTLADGVVRCFRDMLGYDRVMVYKFDPDGHGKIIAEARDPRLESLLGHHYPASDIPQPKKGCGCTAGPTGCELGGAGLLFAILAVARRATKRS